jgi:hypothetical protein
MYRITCAGVPDNSPLSRLVRSGLLFRACKPSTNLHRLVELVLMSVGPSVGQLPAHGDGLLDVGLRDPGNIAVDLLRGEERGRRIRPRMTS